MRRTAVLALWIVAFSIVWGAPQAATPAEVEQRIKRIESGLLPAVLVKGESPQLPKLSERMQALHVPGVSVAVLNDGRIEWARGFGVSRTGGPPVTPDTLFQAASISKPVSALAVMQLVERGKLDLDADVNQYLSTWKLPPNEFTTQQKVTLRRLLSHTAGTTVHGFAGYAAGERVPDLLQLLDGVAPANSPAIRVDKVPGKSWRYSGGGYEVMQLLMEDVTKRKFADLMHERVLEPLGMKQSTFQQPLPAQLLARAATPYLGDGTAVAGGPHVYPELAAAGLWTTPSDLARFAIGLQRAWAGESKAILSSSTVRTMMTRSPTRHGLGPVVGGTAPREYFTHGGANFGYRCVLVGYLDGDGAAIMTNGDGGGELMGELLRTIAREYDWPDFAPPERVLTKVDPATFDRYVGAYRLNPQVVITVWRDGDRTYSLVRGAPVTELFPTSEREYFQKAIPALFEFFPDASKDETALILHENGEQRRATRLTSKESQSFVAESLAIGRRVREQQPAAGSDAMLRKLISGLAAGAPPYDDMGTAFADLTRQLINRMQPDMASLGAIRALTFKEVNPAGADLYDVEFERGRAAASISIGFDQRIDAAWIERR